MTTLILTILFFITAVLYAAVGLGGGSGYLAIMGLLGVEPELMRPTALALNILVAGIGTWRHLRSGQFAARLFWPLALVSVPFAFLGGSLVLPTTLYRPLLGLILLYATVRLWMSTGQMEKGKRETAVLPLWLILLAGAIIGLVSGLIGIGGGIFLGLLLLLTEWADTRQAMGVTAAFVFVNSTAALLGNISLVGTLPAQLPIWLLVTGLGGWLGAELGSRYLNPILLRKLLALILAFAALRMVLAYCVQLNMRHF